MLSPQALDFWRSLVIPFVCGLSIAANLWSSIVFAKLNKSSPKCIYALLLVKSIASCVYLLICLFAFILKYSSINNPSSPSSVQFIMRIYELYLFKYLSSCLGLFDLLLETLLAVERLFAITRREELKRSWLILVTLFIASLLFYLPNVISFEIQKDNE